MLDVHPPHEGVHSWKGFLLHIATITIGLLIAIGLEQTVEYFHHRKEMRETREALDQERLENVRRFHQNVAAHVMSMGYLHNNLRIFEYLRDHPGTAQEKLPGILYWPIGAEAPAESAWTTAQHTDALSLLPRMEVSNSSAAYAKLDYAWQAYQPVLSSLTRCTEFYSQTADASSLSPNDISAEIEMLKRAIAAEAVYGNTLSWVGQLSDFGPAPGHWQMLPYFKMEDYYHWVAAHPEVTAQSDADLDAAKAHAGLPADTPDMRLNPNIRPHDAQQPSAAH